VPCAIALALALGACASTSVREPTARDATWARSRWPGTTVASLKEGRELYVSKCSGCHALHTPARVVAEGWPERFIEMARDAHLTIAERDLVAHYLLAAAQPERGGDSGLTARR